MEYDEDDFLQLSGIQHYEFCRRQWALIHIEKQWAENYRTTDGELFHKNAHDIDYFETRRDTITVRNERIFSAYLGVSGTCDIIEFYEDKNGISLENHDGLWQPFPIEYKRGNGSDVKGDYLQLCGQAMCLEEMLCCCIPFGALYYGEIRRRKQVDFSPELRLDVKRCLSEMHDLYRLKRTPKVKPKKGCNECSLKDLCLPKLFSTQSASDYLSDAEEKLK